MVLRGSIFSNTLNMETGITVITPNNYGQAKKYRVCYVLHGLCGGNADFSNYTMLPYYAYDKDIIFVCPEVGRSFYTDMKYGQNFFTYVSTELPETVKLYFNISAAREDTAVIGCSMGGYGALKCALAKPETFGFAGALSPACLDVKSYLEKCRLERKYDFDDFYSVFGPDFEYKDGDDLLELAERVSKASTSPIIYQCCGTEDDLLQANRAFADEMRAFKLDYTFEEHSGKHDLYFFSDSSMRALDFWRSRSAL